MKSVVFFCFFLFFFSNIQIYFLTVTILCFTALQMFFPPLSFFFFFFFFCVVLSMIKISGLVHSSFHIKLKISVSFSFRNNQKSLGAKLGQYSVCIKSEFRYSLNLLIAMQPCIIMMNAFLSGLQLLAHRTHWQIYLTVL